MENLWTLAAGGVLGLVVIAALNAFPGVPFDYDTSPNDAAPPQASTVSSKDQQAAARAKQVREVEIAASQLKVDKLQELLGLETHEVQKMINQAKADAIRGRMQSSSSSSPSSSPANYTRWLDWMFYGVILALMAITLQSEYSLDVVQMLAMAFPRETETARKVAAILLPTQLPWN